MRDKKIINTSNKEESASDSKYCAAASFRFKALRTDHTQKTLKEKKQDTPPGNPPQTEDKQPPTETKPALEPDIEFGNLNTEPYTGIESESISGETLAPDTDNPSGAYEPNPDGEQVPDKSESTSTKRYLWGAVLITTVIAAYTVFQYDAAPSKRVSASSSIPASNSPEAIASKRLPLPSTPNRSVEIGTIASNLTQESVWDVQKIHILKRNWLRLDSEKQTELYNTDWFVQFRAALEKQINTSLNKNTKAKTAAVARHAALVDLDELLNKTTIFNKSAATSNQTISANNTVLANKDAELAADAHKTRKGSKTGKQEAQKSHETIDPPKTVAIPTANRPAKTNNAGEKHNYVNSVFTGTPKNRDPDKPTIAELNDLVIQLADAYDSGDLERFTSLFARGPNSEHDTQLKQTISQFTKMMRGTSDRQMFIGDMQWSFDKKRAVGTGVLTLTLISDEEPQVDSFFKKIELTVVKEKRKARIAKFEQSEF